MIPGKIIKIFKNSIEPIVKLMDKMNITPNMVTIFGFLVSILSAFFFFKGYFRIAGLTLIFASIFDSLDGALARISGNYSDLGAFLDSSLDRVSEFAILFALTAWCLFISPWTEDMKSAFILILFGVLFCSLFTSYVKARSEGLRYAFKGGLFSRPERVIWITVVSLIGENFIFWGLFVLLILTFITSLERFYKICRNISSGGKNG